ncbi:MAG: BrnA antitoxin family protein [Bryobacteraceae bacterium]
MARNNVKSRTDWGRLSKLTDKAIHKAVAEDPQAAPILSAEWFRNANLLEPQPKKAVSIRLDEDVLEWFKRRGKGYQTRINAVLRAFVESHR